jgi:hypothetical protein
VPVLKKLRVLIACEYSGAVRDAFIARGHDAMSCDLLPTEAPGPHYQGDVRDVLDYPWDLAIFHPPCTHLSVSGARHFEAKKMDGRQQAAVSFFLMLAKADIPRIAKLAEARQAARERLSAAKKARDTRAIHQATNALRAATHRLMRAEVGR